MTNQVIRVYEPSGRHAADLPRCIAAFLAACKAKGLSQNSVDYYRYRLTSFETYLKAEGVVPALADITPFHIRSFLTYEAEHNSPSTAAHAHCALSAFFAYCARDGIIDQNPMTKVDKPRRPKRVLATFTPQQIEQLLHACSGRSFLDVRDRTILLVLFDTGLRASELCGITFGDADIESQTLRVVGKGNKERVVPFGRVVRQALISYTTMRCRLAESDPADTDPLFVTSLGDPLSRHALRSILIARGRQAGITGVRISPHTMRHTAAVCYLRRGGDAFSLQRLLGHSSLEMTRRYCQLSEQDLQDKHRLASPVDGMLKPKADITGRRRRLR